ncbi:flagellar hook-basal body protein [Camelliibacillus cellulosilyticus]|uniref:Flagellar hook-basal body protein n=1 Tax=Camelliibacillus cellulosilyticus TaxID=2174486 RepID=A0ABV9GTY7_9BACL
MDRSMISAAVTMNQLQKGLDVVANNLSNLSTNGYKSRSASFSELLYQNLTNQPDQDQNLGRLTPIGLRMGSGARLSDTQMDTSMGALKQTDRALDVALLKPDQFFQVSVRDDNGGYHTRYTRDGAFYLQPEANNPNKMNIVTASGAFVLGRNGQPLQIPSDTESITINQTGHIQATLRDGRNIQVGDIGVVAMKRPQLLQALGDNMLGFPDLSPLGLNLNDVVTPAGATETAVRQGMLEGSNVDLSREMTNMMMMERAYQFNAKAISVADDMQGLVNGLRP